jgi:hypothetical protein
MDRKTQELLASAGWQNYMIKTYLYKQLSGMIRVIQARYSLYITADQMAEELAKINVLIDTLEFKFINPSTSLVVNGPTNNQTMKQNFRIATDINRCHARVWGDANHLIYKLADGRVVYGCQCKRTKSQGSQYCAKHTQKLTHEDWFAEPSDTIRRHFQKAATPRT